MPTFKARFTSEHEVAVEADDVQAASDLIRAKLRQSPGRMRLLGCISSEQQWPDVDLRSGGEPSRGGNSSPPSGTPGTPVIRHEDQSVQAVAA